MELTDQDLSIGEPLSSVFLLYGKHTYLIHMIRDKIINKAINEEEKDFNLAFYDMESEQVQTAVEDAETLPFMGDKRVVVIENPVFLTNQNKKTDVEHDVERLTKYVQSPAPDSIVIITASYEKLDKRKKLYKQLQKSAQTFELNRVTDHLIYELLSAKANEYGTNYTKEAHEALISMAGDNLQQLMNEVAKLSLYCGEGSEITKNNVDELASRSLEQNVFELVNQVMKKNITASYRILGDMYKQKQEPIKLLALLANQLRLIYQVNLYLSQGYTQQQLAKKLNVHPYRVKIASQQSRSFKLDDLTKALTLCTETDFKMKRGQLDKHLALELCIHQLAS